MNRLLIHSIGLLIVAFAVIGGCSTFCVNKKQATRVLTENGFTNIKVSGYSWFGCGNRDFYSTGFVATNSNKIKVEGTVCSGLIFKNATIRYK